jgi:peptide/nickel transport system ATP-binding protein
MKENRVLTIDNLTTTFESHKQKIQAVRGVSLHVDEGDILAIVGESGSGKSVTMKSVMGLLGENADVQADHLELLQKDLLSMSEKEKRKMRGKDMAMIFQDPMTALNPLKKIGYHMIEVLRRHQNLSKAEARKVAIDMLGKVGIPSAESRMDQYPHEFSGGMRQRAIIALATFMSPGVVLADEPTTALDVVVQKGILMMLMRLQKQLKNTMIIVSHDMGVHYQITDRMAIMYSGSIAELGKTEDIFNDPIHPYTKMLVDALPRVGEDVQRVGIAGRPPALKNPPPGCRFAPRCPHATDRCRSEVPKFREIRPGRFAACHLLEEEVKTNG